MHQIGSIVISENVNTQAIINLLKQDPKVIIGGEETLPDGTRYIPINKN